jgi:hypothetical protein
VELALFNGIRKEILKELDQAQTHIRAAIAWFTNRDLFEKLCQQAAAGKRVELIVIDDFINNGDWGLDFQRFIDLGGHLYYGDPHHPMHHKFCVIDDRILFNGSYNWTYYAESKNVENTIKVKDNQPLIQQFIGEFDSLREKLERRDTAIKRDFNNLSLIDLFSVRNYLAFDLLSKGQQERSLKPVEVATRILPKNSIIEREYRKLTVETVKKRTITNLGVKAVVNGVHDRLFVQIPKGKQVPFKHTHYFRTVDDNQTKIEVETYKGEHADCVLNEKIGSFLVADLPQKAAGKTGVYITFALDCEGALKVVANNKDTGGSMEAIYEVGDLVF